jgi:hypothetical protein
VWKWKFKGYEMVYYRVTRWGTKLWCLLTSYIEKYKVWRSKGKAKAKQGKAGQSRAKQGKAKAKQRQSKGEARRSKGEAKAKQGEAKAKQNICYRGITGGYLAGANLAGDFCGGKSAR